MDVIYTLYPVSFAEEDEQQEVVLCNYRGVKMYAAHLKGREYQVRQILSTEPKDFLRKDLMPGMIIKM